MKKGLALFLAVILALSTLIGCGGGGSDEDTTKSGSDTGEKKTLTIGLMQSATVEDYDTNGLTRWLEEKTGYDIKFQYFASTLADAKSQLATRMASGEKLPDILYSMALGTSVYKEYGDDGYFIDLKEYYEDEEKSANFWNLFEELPEADKKTYRRMLTDENGHMYCFPHLEESVVDTMDYQVYINQTWLDKLGLQAPKSRDELYTVLKAFKEQDPNGNGIMDEIPLIGSQAALSADVVNWILNMFCYVNDRNMFNVDQNGKLYLPFLTDEYREGLKFINKLVSEGLMSTMCWTAGNTQLQQIITPSTGTLLAGIFVGHPTLCVENYNDLLYNYKAMPYFSRVIRNANSNHWNTFVTADCEDPDMAWNFLMTTCSREGALRIRYGEKGVDWVDADPGTTSFCGLPAEIKILNEAAFFGSTTTTWNAVAACVLKYSEGETIQFDDSMGEWPLYKRSIMTDNYNYFLDEEAKTVNESCGQLVYTEEEKLSTEQIRSNCSSIITNSRSKFCTGDLNPYNDADWNAYLQEVQNNGLSTWLELAQATYDRQKTD